MRTKSANTIPPVVNESDSGWMLFSMIIDSMFVSDEIVRKIEITVRAIEMLFFRNEKYRTAPMKGNNMLNNEST